MFFVALLEALGERLQKGLGTPLDVPVYLRGYDPGTWVPPELAEWKIAVSDLAFDVCRTHRNLYLSKVQHADTPGDAGRVEGRAIEQVLFELHRAVRQHVQDSSVGDLGLFDLMDHLAGSEDNLVNRAVGNAVQRSRQIDIDLLDREVLAKRLKRLLRVEGICASAMLHHRISRLPEPKIFEYFQTAMECALEPTFDAPQLGLRSPIKPDFAFLGVPGDIKTGEWHGFLRLAVVSYVLAWEADRQFPLHGGILHHIRFQEGSLVPLHYETTYLPATVELRTLFVQKRDQKLAVLRDRSDPGKPEKKSCIENGCPYIPVCWEAV